MSRRVILALLFIGLFVSGVFLHHWYGLIFPMPWDDETHFFVPAVSFSQNWTFDATPLLHIDGTFWVAPMTYWIYGMAFRILGDFSLVLARWTAFMITFLAGITFYCVQAHLFKTLRPKSQTSDFLGVLIPFLMTALWFFSSPLQITSNVMRPEPVAILLGFLSLLAFFKQRYLAVISMAVLSLLNHSLLGLPNYAMGGFALIHWVSDSERLRKIKRWELALALVALLLVGCEFFRLISNLPIYIGQYRYQLSRKAGRGLNPNVVWTATVTGISWLVYVLAWFKRARLFEQLKVHLTLAVFGFTSLFIYYFGREMWYGPYLLCGWLFAALSGILLLKEILQNPIQNQWQSGPDFLVRINPGWSRLAWVTAFIVAAYFSPLLPFYKVNEEDLEIDIAKIQQLNSERASVISRLDLEPLISAGNVYVSPFLYTDIIELAKKQKLDLTKIFSSSPLSVHRAELFSYFIDITPFWVYRIGLKEVLAGYACTSSQVYLSPDSLFKITVKQLLWVGATQPYIECR